jgi:hypothetical protein
MAAWVVSSAPGCAEHASCSTFCRRGSIASATTDCSPAHLQGQHRARQRTDRRASGSDGSAGRARRRGPGRQRRSRPSPAMPLLRRPHDHRRELWAWRRTPRPAIAPKPRSGPRCHDARHRLVDLPLAGETSLPASHRFRRRIAVAPPSPTARPLRSIRPKSPRRPPPPRQTRHCAHRSAADYIPTQAAAPSNPIRGRPPDQSPRVPSWGAFGRRPSVPLDRSRRAGIPNPSPKRSLLAMHAEAALWPLGFIKPRISASTSRPAKPWRAKM